MRGSAKSLGQRVIPVLLCVPLLISLYACDTFPEDYYFNDAWISGEDWLGAGKRDSVTWDAYSISSDETKAFSFTEFSGIKTAFTIKCSSKITLSCGWDLAVDAGKFKVVLIDVDEKEILETICEGSGSGSRDNIELYSGNYIIRLVGYQADASGEIRIRGTESMENLLTK